MTIFYANMGIYDKKKRIIQYKKWGKYMTINFIIAQIIGILALIILMLSFQKNEKKLLLKYQTTSSFLYAIQYIFLGAYTGSLMNLTCMVRNFKI